MIGTFPSPIVIRNRIIVFLSELVSEKKEKSMISEHEKACSDKIAQLEESLKKKTQVSIY